MTLQSDTNDLKELGERLQSLADKDAGALLALKEARTSVHFFDLVRLMSGNLIVSSGVVYAILCLTGLLYARTYFGRFGVSLEDFSTIQDFFSFGFIAVQIPIGALISVAALVLLLGLFARRSEGDDSPSRLAAPLSVISTPPVFILLCIVVVMSLSYAWGMFKDEPTETVFAKIDGRERILSSRLIGSTAEAAFFLPPVGDKAFVIPRRLLRCIAASREGAKTCGQGGSNRMSDLLAMGFDGLYRVLRSGEPGFEEEEYARRVLQCELDPKMSPAPVYFEHGESQLPQEFFERKGFSQADCASDEGARRRVWVLGYASLVGLPSYNLDLAERRANEVASALEDRWCWADVSRRAMGEGLFVGLRAPAGADGESMARDRRASIIVCQ